MLNPEYRRLRNTNIKLNEKILRAQSREMILTAARLLGMVEDGDTIVTEEEEDINLVIDFCYYEAIHHGETGIAIFLAANPSLSRREKELCQGLSGSYTSFFRIDDTIPEDGVVILWDLLSNREVQLTDSNLSKTAVPGMFFFCRVLEGKGIRMASGIGFVITRLSESALLRQYRRELRKVKYPDEAAARYIAACRMKRVFSDPIIFVDIRPGR